MVASGVMLAVVATGPGAGSGGVALVAGAVAVGGGALIGGADLTAVWEDLCNCHSFTDVHIYLTYA